VLMGPFFVCGSSLSEFWVMGKTLAQRKIPVDLHILVRTLYRIKRFFGNEIDKASSDAVLDILLSVDI